MASTKGNKPIATKKEQVLVTNEHPFYREKGQRCPNCGSTEEELLVVDKTILPVVSRMSKR